MDGNLERANWKHRTELIIGADGSGAPVWVVSCRCGPRWSGIGLCRGTGKAGVGKLILVDGDVVSETNINRQIIAFTDNIGGQGGSHGRTGAQDKPGVRSGARGLLDRTEQCRRLLHLGLDYLADAIDSIDAKLDLIEACLKSGTRIVSSMGAGNRLDPTMFRIADISKTRMCPMARSVRQRLRKRGIESGLTVVFSEEPPVVRSDGPIGSISTTPPAAGLAMASVIVRQLALGDGTWEGWC